MFHSVQSCLNNLHKFLSLLLEERLSASSTLDHDGACYNVIHSPVVLEEEESDEDREKESNGEVLVQRPHSRTVKVRTQKQNKDLDR